MNEQACEKDAISEMAAKRKRSLKKSLKKYAPVQFEGLAEHL